MYCSRVSFNSLKQTQANIFMYYSRLLLRAFSGKTTNRVVVVTILVFPYPPLCSVGLDHD